MPRGRDWALVSLPSAGGHGRGQTYFHHLKNKNKINIWKMFNSYFFFLMFKRHWTAYGSHVLIEGRRDVEEFLSHNRRSGTVGLRSLPNLWSGLSPSNRLTGKSMTWLINALTNWIGKENQPLRRGKSMHWMSATFTCLLRTPGWPEI